ncbi:hypothetical protein P691DRAFT_776684 [Macrolepiota fuliginosa MF-IS2]|uniref:Uncharacterized protein n=1 Tax=Macrolepiota fuliginosa MF-IS2 TaxID=1400762 RepID=A0A9P5XB88_9AGAR|nr:hypothetical protein P691DRAFT_776684 [Macrolepiota fuliginosa MF-IS2]
MGSGNSSWSIINLINAMILRQLEANARQRLRDLGGNPGDDDDLKKTVPQIAARRFKNIYGYEYTDTPTDSGNPQVINYKAPELCDVVPPAADQVTWYLDTQVLSSIDIPAWIREKAVNDLYNHTREIVSSDPTGNQWVHSEYNKSYDMTENVNGRSVKCNSTLIYIYGDLLGDGVRADIAFICYCGVYYTTDSPTVQARRDIDAAAYKAAPPLPNMNPPRQPSTQEELKASLDAVGKEEFKSHFGYAFDRNPPYPPDSYRAKGVESAVLTLNSILHVIPDPKPGDDLTYYIQRLYTGLNIPTTMKSVEGGQSWLRCFDRFMTSAKDQAKFNTAAQYSTIIKTSQGADRSWVSDRLDKNFDIPSVGVNRVRQTGVLKCWYGHETVGGGTTVSVIYIHIMTMIYELEDPFELQTRELFGILGNQLRKEKEPGSQDIPFLQLQQWVTDYSKEMFKERFEFEYRGSESQVPDKKIPGPVVPFSSLFRLEKFPATEAEVQNWVVREVLDENSRVYKRDEIIKSITQDVIKYANDDQVGVNLWYTGGTPNSGRIFPDDENKGRDIQVRAYYLYAHGKLQLGGSDKPTERILVFAIGVITSYVDPWQHSPAAAPAGAVATAGYASATRSAKQPRGPDRIPLKRVSA